MKFTKMFPIFSEIALIKLLDQLYPRIISQIDRDPHSQTYGSCDRNHWMYRLHDFSSGILQQSSLVFAEFYALFTSHGVQDQMFLKKSTAKYWHRLARDINLFTLKLLKRNGYLDEYYPGEKSFAATVFSCYTLLKSALLLEQQEVIESKLLNHTANKLLKRTPSMAANQDIACAAFLGLLSKASDWKVNEVHEKISEFINRENFGCQFSEYGGFDLGYSSVTLNYLAYMDYDETFDTKEHILRLGEMCSYYITPSGNYGGEFGSRSTAYFLPFGFVYAATLDKNLTKTVSVLDLAYNYLKLDDRYLMHYCLPSLAVAAKFLFTKGNVESVNNCTRENNAFIKVDNETKVCSFKKNNACLFIALNKGGTLFLEKDSQAYHNCGYIIKRGAKTFATNILTENHVYNLENMKGEVFRIRIEGRFYTFRIILPSTFKTVVLRILGFMGPVFNKMFKELLIKQPIPLRGVSFIRDIKIDKDKGQVEVVDEIVNLRKDDKVFKSPVSSLRLVPSSKFYQRGEEDASADIFISNKYYANAKFKNTFEV